MVHDYSIMYRFLRSKGISLSRLSAFCEIAAGGGISKAAQGNPNRQSQFSRQLKELEQFFGAELLKRGGTLTEAGHRLLASCEPLLNTLEKVAADLSSTPPVISIGSGESMINWWLIPRLQWLSARLGDLQWELSNLRTGEITSGLLDANLDIGILREDAGCAGITCRPLYTMRFSLCIPKRLAKQKYIPAAVLTGNGKLATELRAVMRAANPKMRPGLYCDSAAQIKDAVESRSFAGVLPTIGTTKLAATEFYISAPAAVGRIQRDYALACNPRTVEVRPFLARVFDEFEVLQQ